MSSLRLRAHTAPSFEALENRLLLTTLYGGDNFIYLNSKGQSVRIDLIVGPGENSRDAAVEIFQHDTVAGVGDMVGLLNGEERGWDDSYTLGSVVNYGQNSVTWQNYDQKKGIRGAKTEVYAIYVSAATPNTRLVVSTLAHGAGDNMANNWMTGVTPWSGGAADMPVVFSGDGDVLAPEGSGMVIIGATREPSGNTEATQLHYVACDPTESYMVDGHGVYPGGALKPGITISPEVTTLYAPVLGNDVQAITSDGASSFYAVDLTAFRGGVEDDTVYGRLGGDVRALTVDANSVFYAVENDLTAKLINSNAASIGTDCRSLAVGPTGLFYTAATNALDEWVLIRSTYDGTLTTLGRIVDANQPTFIYENIRAMDFNPIDGRLYAIATLVDLDTNKPDAPANSAEAIITIPLTATNGQVRASFIAGVSGTTTITGIAFDEAGTLYAVSQAQNKLVTIDITAGSPTLGVATEIGTVPEHITGLECLGATLYGVVSWTDTANNNTIHNSLYRINPTTAAATLFADYTLAGETHGIAYDTNHPGQMIGITDIAGFRLSTMSMGAMLVRNANDGTASSDLGVLADDVEEFLVYGDVTGIDHEAGVLYGAGRLINLDPFGATVHPTGDESDSFLFTVSTDGGVATTVGEITGDASSLTTLAFHQGTLYGVSPIGDALVTVDPATGDTTAIGLLGESIVGLASNDNALYGVTNAGLYAIDPTTANTVQLSAHVGFNDMTALAFDSHDPAAVYSVTDDGGYRLLRVGLTSTLVHADRSNSNLVGGLFDDTHNPGWAFTNIRAMDFIDGELIAVANIVNADPFGAPDPGVGLYLITINTTTGQVEIGPEISGATNISSIAQAQWGLYANVVFGVNSDTNELITIDTDTGVVTTVGVLSVPEVVGLDFVGDTLYAVTPTNLYTVNPGTAVATHLQGFDLTDVGSLTATPETGETGEMWTAAVHEGHYHLVRLMNDPESAGFDFDRIRVGGVVAGQISTVRSINIIEVGYLWGDIDVGHNLGAVILHRGGGGWAQGTDVFMPSTSVIGAVGTIGHVESQGYILNSAVYAQNDPNVASPASVLDELEYVNIGPISPYWLSGEMILYRNDTAAFTGTNLTAFANAQFVSHPDGDFSVQGLVDYYVGDLVDWYAVPLLAGQNFNINGFGDGLLVRMFDSAGRLVETFGYETVEDWGTNSRGLTYADLDYTVRAADTYYFEVSCIVPGVMDYTLNFMGVSEIALGGINVIGNYGSPLWGPLHLATDVSNVNSHSIMVDQGGTLGAMTTWQAAESLDIKIIGNGDVISIVGRQDLGSELLLSFMSAGGHVGQVACAGSMYYLSIVAGDEGGLYNANAHIQNLVVGQNLYGVVSPPTVMYATGSIGVIDVGGDMSYISIAVNTDRNGPGGFLDLLKIGGDYEFGSITHGPGGDVGFISVAGDIYNSAGNNWGPVIQPRVVTGGASMQIEDSGGGTLRMTSNAEPVLDAEGKQVMGPDGQPLMRYSTISYVPLLIDGGTGVAIAQMTVDGPAAFETTGAVQIGDLELDLTGGAVVGAFMGPDVVRFSGSGQASMYYVSGGGGTMEFLNNTTGQIVSGSLTGTVSRLVANGSIGAFKSRAASWVYGHDVAPTANILVEPQYGWLKDKINGLNIVGSLGSLTVGGSLGDLRVTGEITKVVVDSDRITTAGGWDGVCGVVWSQTRIGTIDVGDGLADDGGAERAQAAILSSGSIRQVSIDGEYGWGTDARTGLPVAFGQINGAIIAMHDELLPAVDSQGNPVLNGQGLPTFVEVDAVNAVIGTGGARLTSLIIAGGLDGFQVMKDTPFVSTGNVGTVRFSGRDAAIMGAEINGLMVKHVEVANDGYGMQNVYIMGDGPDANKPAVWEVLSGGRGFDYLHIATNGGGIGKVKATGPSGDLLNSEFNTHFDVQEVGAREMSANNFTVAGKINLLQVTGSFRNHEPRPGSTAGIYVGGIEKMTVAGDLRDNYFNVASFISSLDVRGAMRHTYLSLQGPTVANLKSLKVAGDIDADSNIIVAGQIGSIVSVNGRIDGDIQTLRGGWSGNVGRIEAFAGIFGMLDISGSVGSLISHVGLGDDPVATGTTQVFDIGGGLDYLQVGDRGQTSAHLYADLNVGGDIGRMVINGTLFGQVFTNGNVGTLEVTGSFGGMLGGQRLGSLTVMGAITTMKLPTDSDLFADLTVGGSIGNLTIKNASILGNITSRYGSVGNITVTGGSIEGDILGQSLGRVTVTNGNIEGDLTTRQGGIAGVTVKNGELTSVIDSAGDIGLVSVTGGSLGSLPGVEDITSGGSIKSVSVSGGALNANLAAARDIGKVTVAGGNLLGDLTAGGNIDSIAAKNDINNVEITAGGIIKSVSANTINASTVAAAGDLMTVKLAGNLVQSVLASGLDLANNVAHAGSIKSLTIGGVLDASVVAAGIDPTVAPGADTLTLRDGYLSMGDNTEAAGESRILRLTVKGGFSNVGDSAVLADTSVDQQFAAIANAVGMTVDAGVTPSAPPVGTAFGPASPGGATSLTIGSLTFTLTGSGVGYYNAGTQTISLTDTTSKSSLKLVNTGAPVTLNIVSSDDGEFKDITTTGAISLGNVTVDGLVGKLQCADGLNGAWLLHGGVNNLQVDTLTNTDIQAGAIGSVNLGDFVSGTLTADSIKSLAVTGDLAGDVTTHLAGIDRVSVGGSVTGDMDVSGNIKNLAVTNALAGEVLVRRGDVGRIAVGSMTGLFNVEAGGISGIAVRGSVQGGEASFRSAMGVGSITVGGDFEGLLSTGGQVKTFSVRGELGGRVWAGGSIGSVQADTMDGAAVFSSLDIKTVRIVRDLVSGYILAGYAPGDAGAAAGEADNLMIDAHQTLVTADTADAFTGGRVGKVTVGGDMGRTYNDDLGRYEYYGATIAAGIGPGGDGFFGTNDDVVSGVGYVDSVIVTGGIYGSATPSGIGLPDESYGVFAACCVGKVMEHKRNPFVQNQNATVGTISGSAGNLRVVGVQMDYNSIWVEFNHPIDWNSIDPASFQLLVSANDDFTDGLDTNVSTSTYSTLSYDPVACIVRLTLKNKTWQNLGLGDNYMLVLDGTTANAIRDARGFVLDGEFTGRLPSGDRTAGGDFEYQIMMGERPGGFGDAGVDVWMQPVLDGGLRVIGGSFLTDDDIDLFSFQANQYEFFSVEYVGLPLAQLTIFYRDTQGTLIELDDTFEQVARNERTSQPGDVLFQALELPETGEYFVMIAGLGYSAGFYTLRMTHSTSDVKLVEDVGGSLPADCEIGYFSNTISNGGLDPNRNLLGANDPKQLVYVNFDGGLTTDYEDGYNVSVPRFDASELNVTLAGMDQDIIHGGNGVTGILEHIVAIYQDTPANNPKGQLNVNLIDVSDPADWAAYQAATDGLWFTWVNPTVQGLDPRQDFTTAFVGPASDWGFGGSLFGIASNIDVCGQDKADNALIFTGTFAGLATANTPVEIANQYSLALANVVAHELGHTFGLNHHPTDQTDFLLREDDPDNNDLNNDPESGANRGVSLMAYTPYYQMITERSQLGTSILARTECPVGHADHVDQLLNWFA